MKYYIYLLITTMMFGASCMGLAQVQDFFAPSSTTSQTKTAPTRQSQTMQLAAEQVYKQWLMQYQKLQQKTLKQSTIDPRQYNLPMPHYTEN